MMAKLELFSKGNNMTRDLVEDLAHQPISGPFRCKCQMAEPKFLTALSRPMTAAAEVPSAP